jgi:hypothetical protein
LGAESEAVDLRRLIRISLYFFINADDRTAQLLPSTAAGESALFRLPGHKIPALPEISFSTLQNTCDVTRPCRSSVLAVLTFLRKLILPDVLDLYPQ